MHRKRDVHRAFLNAFGRRLGKRAGAISSPTPTLRNEASRKGQPYEQDPLHQRKHQTVHIKVFVII